MPNSRNAAHNIHYKKQDTHAESHPDMHSRVLRYVTHQHIKAWDHDNMGVALQNQSNRVQDKSCKQHYADDDCTPASHDTCDSSGMVRGLLVLLQMSDDTLVA